MPLPLDMVGGMQRPTWFLDETTSLGRENTDPEHVAHYDAKEDAGTTMASL